MKTLIIAIALLLSGCAFAQYYHKPTYPQYRSYHAPVYSVPYTHRYKPIHRRNYGLDLERIYGRDIVRKCPACTIDKHRHFEYNRHIYDHGDPDG